MSFSFDRPVGAAADVKELEYISALHQTVMPNIRKDGSIDADDISSFLASRFRIYVTPEKVRKTILAGLGGGEDEDECIDLMEIMAVLIIPALIKAASEVHGGIDYLSKDADDELSPKQGLIKYVIQMILHDVTDSTEPKKLDADLLAEIFRSYGEKDLAGDSALLKEMIELASEGEPKDVEAPMMKFDTVTFARALTNDVLLYDVENEFSTKTVFSEVFEGMDKEDTSNSFVAALKGFFSFQWVNDPIDVIAGNARSQNLVMCLWALFILFFFDFTTNNPIRPDDDCPTTFVQSEAGSFLSCLIVSNIILWIVKVLVIGIIGWAVVCLPNIGNFVRNKSLISTLAGLTFSALLILLSNTDGVPGRSGLIFIDTSAVILALVAALYHLQDAINYITPKSVKENNTKLASYLESGTIKDEVKIKRAASYKIHNMINNALAITKANEGSDNVMDTYFGQSLLSFSKLGDQTEKSGGFVWTVKNLWNGNVYNKEGLWISGKIRANCLTMIIISIFILWGGINITVMTAASLRQENIDAGVQAYINSTLDFVGKTIVDFTKSGGNMNETATNLGGIVASFLTENAQNSNIDCSAFSQSMSVMDPTDLISNLSCEGNASCSVFDTEFICTLTGLDQVMPSDMIQIKQLEVLKLAGFDITSIVDATRATLLTTVTAAVNNLYPTNFSTMILLPAIVFTIVASLVGFFLSAIYIPSGLTTTLKLRTGVIPTFDNPGFAWYRNSPDSISFLSGSIFWGTIVSSILLGALSAIGVFFLFWQVTRPIIFKLIATLIGVIVTLSFKSMVLIFYRKKSFRALYRRIPGISSFFLVFFESVDFALSVYFTIVRLIKLIVISLLFVGRLDTPLLAPTIPNAADSMPEIFTKEILLREAHRHPYLSLMGTIYLLKLKNGHKFINRAGSAWRLIFVYALFPWLSKYRILGEAVENGKADREIDLSSDFQNLRSDFSRAESVPDLKEKIVELQAQLLLLKKP